MPFYTYDNVPDSPINNFATINALDTNSTLSEGNLKVVTGGNNYYAMSNYPLTEGKWYYEFAFHSGDPAQVFYPEEGYTPNNSGNVGADHGISVEGSLFISGYGAGSISCSIWGVGGWATTAEDTEYNAGTNWKYEVAGIYIDHTGSDITIYLYRNGVLRRKVRAGSALIFSKYYFGYKYLATWPASTQSYNFGQDPYLGGKGTAGGSYQDSNGYGQFNHKPVDENGADLEFYSFCTANLPEGPIKLSQDQTPSDNFKAVTYVGNGGTQSITGVGFQPDFVWSKSMLHGDSHALIDAVRGGDKALYSNATVAENAYAADTATITFDSDGFSFTEGGLINNRSGGSHVAWCFRAAGSPADNQAKIINEDGTQADTTCAALASAATNAGASNVITPSKVSANRQNGFSIVKYQGILDSNTSTATIPHGLNDCEFCMIKNIRWSNTWVVSHRSIAPNVMSLQHSGQAASTPPVDPAYGQISTLGSNTVTITRGSIRGDNVGEDHAETNGQFEYIAYCWHSVAGYSKCGSYVGNGSADGPYVECGFRVGWLMVKQTDSSGNNWVIIDSARNPYNPVDQWLMPNEGHSTYTYTTGDFTSSGFKLRNTGSGTNSGKYIFMAFAEQPFSGPSNAR